MTNSNNSEIERWVAVADLEVVMGDPSDFERQRDFLAAALRHFEIPSPAANWHQG